MSHPKLALRPYQKALVEKILEGSQLGRQDSETEIVLGTGGTRILVAVAERLVHSGKTVAFMAVRQVLVEQYRRALDCAGLPQVQIKTMAACRKGDLDVSVLIVPEPQAVQRNHLEQALHGASAAGAVILSSPITCRVPADLLPTPIKDPK